MSVMNVVSECYSESETRGNGGMGHRGIILTCRAEAWRRGVLILEFVSTIQLFNVSTHPNFEYYYLLRQLDRRLIT